MNVNFSVSVVLLIVAIILFVVAALNVSTFSHTSDVEIVSAGLAFFAGSFLPWRS